MYKYLDEKIRVLEKINTDDSNFIIKVIEAYKKDRENFIEQSKNSKIVLKSEMDSMNENIIDLDKIWAKKYYYTKMRTKIENIVNLVNEYKIEEFENNSKKICKKIIFNNTNKEFFIPEEKIDIVEFLKQKDKERLKSNKDFNFTFIADKKDEGTIFKEQILNTSINIINMRNKIDRYKKIYEETCTFLDNDFISNNYCDFKNNKCVAQRHLSYYNLTIKNGCCYSTFSTCKNLLKGKCKVNCLPCKLFACPYLTKRGIGYFGNEFILFQAFLTKQQRKHFIFDFYKDEETILSAVFVFRDTFQK